VVRGGTGQLVAAVHQAARADPPHAAAWQLPNVLWWYFYPRKHSAYWITAARRGLAAARRIRREAGNTYGRASTVHNLGDTYLAAGRYDTAFGYLHRALELCAELENPHGTATVLFSLGRGQCLAGQPDRARHSLVRALALFTELRAPQAADVRAHLERLAGHRPAQGPVRSG
jgi:tetratricopeptide (TPR) repeat protein